MTGSSPQADPEVDTLEAQAPQAVEATENSAAPEVKKGRGKAKAIFEELQEHKESENLVTKEKRVRGRQASSKDGTEKPAKTSEEPLPNDQIESSLPAVPVVETKEKRGRDKRAVVISVSKADSEEEAVEEVKEAKAKKRVAVAKKQVEDKEQKSAVLEEVCAPAEVMETIESPETVPAKKRRGKKAAGKKDAIEEAIVSAEPEIPEDEKEIKKGRSK